MIINCPKCAYRSAIGLTYESLPFICIGSRLFDQWLRNRIDRLFDVVLVHKVQIVIQHGFILLVCASCLFTDRYESARDTNVLSTKVSLGYQVDDWSSFQTQTGNEKCYLRKVVFCDFLACFDFKPRLRGNSINLFILSKNSSAAMEAGWSLFYENFFLWRIISFSSVWCNFNQWKRCQYYKFSSLDLVNAVKVKPRFGGPLKDHQCG